MAHSSVLRSFITSQFLSRRRSALAGALLLFSAALPASASITYTLVNYPAGQNGWNLTGSITTDGTLGPITQLNILSWSYQYSQVGGVTYTESSSWDGLATGQCNAVTTPHGSYLVASGPLSLPGGSTPEYPYPGDQAETTMLWWISNNTGLSFNLCIYEWELVGGYDYPPYQSWDWVLVNDATVTYSTGFPCIIGISGATPVPEPATIVVWSLLGALAISFGWWQWRKAA